MIQFTLVSLAVMPVLWGQLRLGSNQDGAGILFLAGFAMAAVASLWRKEPWWSPSLPPPDSSLSNRWWWALPSIPLAGACFYLVYNGNDSFQLIVRLWFVSLALLVCPFLIRIPTSVGDGEEGALGFKSFSPPPTRRVKVWEIGLSTSLLLVAIAFRLPYLERFPALIHVD